MRYLRKLRLCVLILDMTPAAPHISASSELPPQEEAAPLKAPAIHTVLEAQQRFRHLKGRKYIKRLDEFIHDLRRHHPHHNRILFYDDVVTILLLGFFNSDIRSLRKLELFSQVPGVRQSLNVERVSRSALSEGLKLFDPKLLRPLIEQIHRELPKGAAVDPEIQELYERLIAFDGSYFRVPAQVLWAIQEKGPDRKKGRQVRLNLQYCVSTGNPEEMSIGGEGSSEAQAITTKIEPDMIYLGDRGILSFNGVSAIVSGGGHLVFRIKRQIGFTSEADQPLTEKDKAHRVISDRIGRLTGSQRHPAPTMKLREILIENPDDPDQPIRLLTDLLDQPAYITGLLYRFRWDIELFFRWLKVHANFEHIISHSPHGVETWFYVAMIGTLLMSLYTGERPTTYAFTAMQLIVSGEASYEDLAPQLARLARERQLARERLARRKAAKNSG